MDSTLTRVPKNKKSISDLFAPIGKWFSNFGKRFADGSIGTKLSHFIFGAGNFYHKQYITGALFLILQVAIICVMVFCPTINGTPYGYKALANLSLKNVSEGGDFDPITGEFSAGSDCKLMILFGFVTIAVIIIYFMLMKMSITSSVKADMDEKIGKKPSTFREDVMELFDSRFHITMLTPTCIAALIFTILPTIFMIALAFTTYNSQDMNDKGTNLFHWNGIDNFIAVFTGEGSLGMEIKNRFLPVLGWTFIWAIFATLSCYFGGIIR